MALKGKDAHMQRLKRLSGAEVVKAAGRVLFVGAERIKSTAQNMITRGSASGTSGGKHQHVPSKPGDPPHNFTGVLKDNIEAALKEPLVAEVSSNAPYAAHLEFGTSKMAARPYMRVARDREKDWVQRLFTKEIDKLVARSGT